MDDDFNTPQALAALFDLARDINRAEEEGTKVDKAREILRELGGVLGLTFKESGVSAGDAAPFIELMIATRDDLRKARQFQLADDIRHKLEGLGITLEDTPTGTVWKKKR
jgi:cysteinyl-tRNA synthetase